MVGEMLRQASILVGFGAAAGSILASVILATLLANYASLDLVHLPLFLVAHVLQGAAILFSALDLRRIEGDERIQVFVAARSGFDVLLLIFFFWRGQLSVLVFALVVAAACTGLAVLYMRLKRELWWHSTEAAPKPSGVRVAVLISLAVLVLLVMSLVGLAGPFWSYAVLLSVLNEVATIRQRTSEQIMVWLAALLVTGVFVAAVSAWMIEGGVAVEVGPLIALLPSGFVMGAMQVLVIARTVLAAVILALLLYQFLTQIGFVRIVRILDQDPSSRKKNI